jgi:HAD superfamily hydrolase (TIGR01509 family)
VPRTVFLDIDGVLSDSTRLGADFNRMIGDVMVPALGGTHEDWGRANAATFEEIFLALLNSDHLWDDPAARFDEECRRAINAMCNWLGIEPPEAAEASRLGREYNRHVRRNGSAAFPEAPAVLRALATDHDLHLATGNIAANAVAVLEQIGTPELIGFPCGVDLVGVAKHRPAFYERLFAAVGVTPEDSVVIDDVPAVLAHAANLGAAPILVAAPDVDRSALPHDTIEVTSITEVPGAVSAIEAGD